MKTLQFSSLLSHMWPLAGKEKSSQNFLLQPSSQQLLRKYLAVPCAVLWVLRAQYELMILRLDVR